MSAVARQRITAMHDFVEMMDRWAADIRRVPRSKLTMLMKLGSAVFRFLPARAAPETAVQTAPDVGLASADAPPGDETMRESTVSHIFKNWTSRDASAARAFLNQSGWPQERISRLLAPQ